MTEQKHGSKVATYLGAIGASVLVGTLVTNPFFLVTSLVVGGAVSIYRKKAFASAVAQLKKFGNDVVFHVQDDFKTLKKEWNTVSERRRTKKADTAPRKPAAPAVETQTSNLPDNGYASQKMDAAVNPAAAPEAAPEIKKPDIAQKVQPKRPDIG